ncbi:Cytochrome p450(bm-3) / nadph-cytochrome p450 reductase [Giardia duodenalis assemblage B]|uniref:Cytochrome p450(Bm-3) / nadph-cytochrome p450 reductase n=1 Tax=Giardia duodenalis assemblage B TaxID=1394984 RepID=A0A132NNA1_GIAIN|nr:Cytochrome p450(bm-3) / nadph-cytochrome p450 reductase [Giardia intestinalis assemblage B]
MAERITSPHQSVHELAHTRCNHFLKQRWQRAHAA